MGAHGEPAAVGRETKPAELKRQCHIYLRSGGVGRR